MSLDQGFIEDCYFDPVLFMTDPRGLRMKLREWQERGGGRIGLAFLRGLKNLRVHICSCHTAGKTTFVAALFLWWLVTRYLSRAVTTAPTQKAVDRLLWGEIRRLYAGSGFAGQFGEMMDSSEFRSDFTAAWYGVGVSSDRPDNLEGHHSPTAMFIAFDEAKAVDDKVHRALQGALHSPESLEIAISTPWLNRGWFYEMDRDGGDDLIRIKVTIDDLIREGVPGSREAKERYARQFGGEESPEFQARAMARYISSNPFGAIRAEAVDACMALKPAGEGIRSAGFDVARGDEESGNDECVIALAEGYDVLEIDPFRSRDLVYSTNRFSAKAREFGAMVLRPDANGIGAGPTDMLRAEGWREDQVEEFVAQARPADPTRFANRATECAWHFAQRINRVECALPKDDELRRQCLQVQFRPVAGGKLKLVKAPKIDGQKTSSPDRFEACVMATADPIPGDADGLLGYLEEFASGEKQAA